MSIRVGNSPSSWGVWFAEDPKQPAWPRFLDEVAEAGYEWIELGPYGYLPTHLPNLRAELDRRNLKVSSAHAMDHLEDQSAWPRLEKKVRQTGELLAALGAKFLILLDRTYSDLHTGELTRSTRLDESAWRRLIDTVHKVADIVAREFALKLLFEPHSDCHVESEKQIETLLEQTDSSRVSLMLDTGHHIYRAGDPIDFVRRHHGRIPYLHLKNIDPEVRKKVQTGKVPFPTAVGMGLWSEPSQGPLDFVALGEILGEIGWDGWAIVEQGMYPAPLDKPLPAAKRTRAYLRQIGFGK
jgi:inosose dehydratase